MYLHSISAYADKLVDQSTPDEIARLNELNDSGEWARARSNTARMIRNVFGLWNEEHPLTAHWHKFPDERNIVEGVDYSVDHPDSVSMRILEAAEKKLLSKPLNTPPPPQGVIEWFTATFPYTNQEKSSS